MRHQLRLLLAAILLASAVHAIAAEQKYESAEAFIKSLPPAPKDAPPPSQDNLVLKGDLNADGREDVAIIAGMPQPRLYILLQGPDHAFRLAVSSKMGYLDQVMNNAYEDVEGHIEKGSLYVSTEWAGTATQGNYTQQYQIKFYRHQWRVIGITYHDAAASYTPTPSGAVAVNTYTADFNLLTGRIIVTSQHLGDGGDDDHTGTTRHKVAKVKICRVEDFAFDLSCVADWKTRKGKKIPDLFTNLF